MIQRLEAMRERVRIGSTPPTAGRTARTCLGRVRVAGVVLACGAARLTRRMCEAEQPRIDADQQIVFTRTVPRIPPIYSSADAARLTAGPDGPRIGPHQ